MILLGILEYFNYLEIIRSSKSAMQSSAKGAGANCMATIIVQENDSAVLDVLTQALELKGHLPIPILGSCPIEMTKSVKLHYPDLVLVDYRSTNDSGKNLLAAIRKVSSWLPVMALSCDLNISKVASVMGFNNFLSKPFDLDEFFGKVSLLLSKPNLI